MEATPRLCDSTTVFVARDVTLKRDFDVDDLDGNHLCFGMESKR
jgi:hypothetical protein